MVLRSVWLTALILFSGCDLITSPGRDGRTVRDVSVGAGFTCAVTEEGRTYCWGSSIFLRSEPGDTRPVLTPTRVVTSTSLSTIYVGLPFCGVDRNSRLQCWISSTEGQIDQDADIVSEELRLIVDGSDFGVDAAGELVHLANGTVDPRKPLAPREIVAKVMTAYFEGTRPNGEPAQHYHGCALTTEGEAFCEGTNRYGELGLGPAEPMDDSSRPYKPVLTDVRFGSLYAAGSHTCGISTSQELYCWGEGCGPVPRKLMEGTHFASMDASSSQNCGVTVSGAGLCWDHENQDNFTEVAPAIRFRKISVYSDDTHEAINPDRLAGGHACGISIQGDLYCWGSNKSGQLGTGSQTDEPIPARVLIRD